LGWLFEKRCLLLHAYPQMTEHYIRNVLSGAKGWAYANWAREKQASMFGSEMVRRTPGYVKQEYEKIWLKSQ